MSDKTYEDGLMQGQINAVEAMMGDHKVRLDNHGNRLRILERVLWGVFGVVVLIEILPSIKLALGAG